MKRPWVIGLLLLCAACLPRGHHVALNAEGQRCFYNCKSVKAACEAHCSDLYCSYNCLDAEDYCIRACAPNLVFCTDRAGREGELYRPKD